MFRIKYTERGVERVESGLGDTRTILDILIGILNNEVQEQELYNWCSNANWGDTITKHGVTIECYSEVMENVSKTVETISKASGVRFKLFGEKNDMYVWDGDLALVTITYDKKSGQWTLRPMRSNGTYTNMVVEQKENMFIPKSVKVLTHMLQRYPHEVHSVLQNIANKITERTGIPNKWIGEDGGSIRIDFGYGKSYMKNMGGEGLYFICIDDNDTKIFEYSTKHGAITFMKEVISRFIKLSDTKRKIHSANAVKLSDKYIKQRSMRNEDILKELNLGDKNTIRIYEDNCWWLDIERTYNRNYRVWVGFEDKRTGKCRASLVSLWSTYTSEIRYSTDGIVLKKSVEDKLISTVRFLIKNGILNID